MKMAGGFTGLSCATAALFAFLTYRFIFWPALFSPLARIPNAHWSVPFSRLWILRIRFTHRENKTLFAAHRRHGPIVRVGPSELSIDDVDCVRTVYQGGFEKTSWYSVFDNYGYGMHRQQSIVLLSTCAYTLSKALSACFRQDLLPSTRHGSG